MVERAVWLTTNIEGNVLIYCFTTGKVNVSVLFSNEDFWLNHRKAKLKCRDYSDRYRRLTHIQCQHGLEDHHVYVVVVCSGQIDHRQA